MNWAIMKNTWQMCRASKLRLIVLTLFILYPLVKTTSELCIQKEFPKEFITEPAAMVPFVLACGSGCIGRQLNDGTLSLVLSRPLRISEYALSKWMAVSIAASLMALIQFAGELAVLLARTPYWADAPALIANCLERVLVCFGFSAVFVFFSSLVSGSKDLAIYLVSYILVAIAVALGSIKPDTLPEGLGRWAAKLLVPIVRDFGAVLDYIIKPYIDFSPLLTQFSIQWMDVTAYGAVIAIFLSFSIYSLNRRELPYGAD